MQISILGWCRICPISPRQTQIDSILLCTSRDEVEVSNKACSETFVHLKARANEVASTYSGIIGDSLHSR
jgi:hypothetical protein